MGLLKVFIFACFLMLQGSSVFSISPSSSTAPALSPAEEQTTRRERPFGSGAPTSVSDPNGTISNPPLALPALKPSPGPITSNEVAPPLPPNAPKSMSPQNFSPPPFTSSGIIPALPPSNSEHPTMGPETPVLAPSPPRQYPQKSPVRRSLPPNSHQNEAPIDAPLAPVKAPAPTTVSENAPRAHLVTPVEPPSTLPEPPAPSPSNLRGTSPPVRPTLPKEPPSSSPGESNAPPLSTPTPMNGTSNHHLPQSPSPTNAPSAHNGMRDLNSAPAPLPYPKFAPNTGISSPASLPSTTIQKHHHSRNNMSASAPRLISAPPRVPSKLEGRKSPAPSPSPLGQTKMPLPPHKTTNYRSLPKYPKLPFQALPPPPPNADCASLTCSEPLTTCPTGPLCICVLPIQVGLRLGVALYTFFPLVSELAVEIAAGVFMKQSQVRIMGANEATQDPEKTIVLIDLVPLGEKFDNTTAYLTFLRFWNKRVGIKTSLFGNYEVLYLRYPGLPLSPPAAFWDVGVVNGEPFHNPDNNARAMKPIGVDVSGIRHKNRPNRSLIAAIVLSASVAVVLCCAVAWVSLLKNRNRVSQPEGTPPTTIPSREKSAGVAASTVGSDPSSASLSYGSSIAAYTGSARTFSSSEILKATDNFDETRIVGEGGFGRVYSGVLDDGTKVAVKVLKRDDHQGGREFLAEVEMLSRLHHRNLVKLIGICIEDRSRCLVYELIPNGSVDSHLHGEDKETAPLDWASRLKIALGSARGLAYLHEDSSPRVIHRDFKSSNILLENDFMPKVSDFGLARTGLDEENKHISTRVMGTFGYVAPEYAMTGHLLVKSDVYSYGVVLLEILTGRKPVDMSQPPGQENLVSWARPLLTSEEGLALMVDESLGPNFPFDSIAKVAAIASMCVEPEVSNRPFMGEVVQALKLVCNECDETKEVGSRSYSQEDLPIDMDPLCNESPISRYECGRDLERGLSMSELLSSSMQFERSEYNSHRRHSSSGPLTTKNTKQLWQKMRRLSRSSASEHGVLFRLWPGSY